MLLVQFLQTCTACPICTFLFRRKQLFNLVMLSSLKGGKLTGTSSWVQADDLKAYTSLWKTILCSTSQSHAIHGEYWWITPTCMPSKPGSWSLDHLIWRHLDLDCSVVNGELSWDFLRGVFTELILMALVALKWFHLSSNKSNIQMSILYDNFFKFWSFLGHFFTEL